MNTDEQWLRDRLGDAVPAAPGSPDRLTDLAERRSRRQRRRAVVGVFATCAAVAAASVAGVAVLRDDAHLTPAPTEQTTTTQQAPPTLECPTGRSAEADSGPGRLESGAVAAPALWRSRGPNGNDWVTLPPAARDAVDRLIAQAHVHVDDGSEATTA